MRPRLASGKGKKIERIFPEMPTTRMFRANIAKAALGPTKKATSAKMMVILAAQGIMVARMETMNRCWGNSRILVAITAGTLHPYPRMNGMIDLPMEVGNIR